MRPETAKIIMELLKRVPLNGNEVDAFIVCRAELGAIQLFTQPGEALGAQPVHVDARLPVDRIGSKRRDSHQSVPFVATPSSARRSGALPSRVLSTT